ncbi:MAG TPA: hypothetical protein VGH19_08155 [Verrucomicrobiae bacterium]
MKNTQKLLLTLILLCAHAAAWGQTEVLITQGRAALAAHDMPTATLRFSEAVQSNANHETANFFYGLTRILNSAHTSAGQNFLNQLGISASGRNIYEWDATVAEDGNGDPEAPSGMSASAFTVHLRNQILPEIVNAEANLAKVVSPSFRVSLTADETGSSAVDIDYADVLMLRALLKGLNYWIYTVNSWNTDVQLITLKSLAVNQTLNAKDLLTAYPQLFTFTTTADQTAARTAFEDFVTFYLNASLAIRNRSSQTDLLFQYDTDMAVREENFRQTITELKTSLTSPNTALTQAPGLTFSLANHFSASGAPRNFLPKFSGDAFVRGTLPDVTFGGVAMGLKRSDIEDFLSDVTLSVPNILTVTYEGNQASGFSTLLISDIAYNETFTLYTGTEIPFNPPTAIPVEYSFVSTDANGNRRIETTYTTPAGSPASFFTIQSVDTILVQGYVYDSFRFPVSGALVRLRDDHSQFTFTSLDGYYSMVLPQRARLPYTAYRLEAIDELLGTVQTGYRFRNETTDIQFAPPAITPPTPANDNFANGITISGLPVTTSGTNVGATREAGEPQHTDINDPFAGRQSVWWYWTSTVTGPVEINTSGSNYDTLLGVYTGSSVGALTQVAANDGHPEDDYQISRVTFNAVTGTMYRIAVDGWRSANGSITLNIKTP